ncbi:Pro-resilin-like 144, partial [Homarus americanus]
NLTCPSPTPQPGPLHPQPGPPHRPHLSTINQQPSDTHTLSRPTILHYQKPSAYDYVVHDDYTGTHFGHSETRDHYLTQGRYYVHLPDRRLQTVTYYADQTGYHPTVTYEGETTYHTPEPTHYALQNPIDTPRTTYLQF